MAFAVITQYIGTLTETFIRRHIQDLYPGKTATIAMGRKAGWTAPGPTIFTRWSPTLFERAVRRASAGRIELWRPDRLPRTEQRRLKRFLLDHNVTVALGQYLDYSVRFLPLFEQLGIPLFVHAHGYDISKCLRDSFWRREYLRYNESAGIITVSQASKESLVRIGIRESKISVIPCGVDVPSTPVARLPNSNLRCLAVGRMTAKKAPLLLLDAFRHAVEHLPQLYLDYVGAGELLSAAQDFCRKSNLDRNVTLHGAQSSEVVQRLMRESDIFLQHSVVDPLTGDEEGLPVAILEAMAQSLPVISTRHAGIPEAVEDGVTGYLVNEGDSLRMAECILACSRDATLRHQMGTAGSRRAKERFSWDTERQALTKLLKLDEP
jgi:colanic acid/amylovoran biosynthesis glycosyltransferase